MMTACLLMKRIGEHGVSLDARLRLSSNQCEMFCTCDARVVVTKKFLTNHPKIPHNITQHVRILAGGAPHSTCLCVRRIANAQEYVRVSPFVEKGASVKRE